MRAIIVSTIVAAIVAFIFGCLVGQGSKTADSDIEHLKIALSQSRGDQLVMRRQLLNFDRIVRSTIIAVWIDTTGDTNVTMRAGDSAVTLYRVRSK